VDRLDQCLDFEAVVKLFTADVNAPASFRPARLDEIMTGVRQSLALRIRKRTPLTGPQRTRDYLMTRLATREFETFTLIYLDTRHRLIAGENLDRGTIDGASVHPREVVKKALRHNAAAVILAHNHPSFVAEPSQADGLIRRLRDALALVDIRLLDHIVVAGGETLSFAKGGLL
jgi:DNA repair protein RadC